MVFKAGVAIAWELLAVTAALGLILWAKSVQGGGKTKTFAIIVAYFGLLAGILTMLGTGYYTFRYWKDGWFARPVPPRGRMTEMRGGGIMSEPGFMGRRRLMVRPGMKSGDGKNDPMMEQKMKVIREQMEDRLKGGAQQGGTQNPGPEEP